MSGASEARDTLTRCAASAYGPLRDAASVYGRAHQAPAPDLTDAMRNTVALIVAAEHLQERAAETVKALRATLAQVMSETGAVSIQAEHFTAHISSAPQRVWVQDLALVPPNMIVQSPPKPDLVEIGKRLRAKEPVAGCVLAGNREPVLVLKARRETA